MVLQRDGYHHGDLRNALVALAVRLIETSGTSSFSLREAAREVGVSANAAYRHFDDKSALMTAVAAFGFRQLATQMVGAMASAAGGRAKGPASVARFKAVGRAYVEFAVAHPELFRVMFGECGAECRKAEPGDDATEDPWSSPHPLAQRRLREIEVLRHLRRGLTAHDQPHRVCSKLRRERSLCSPPCLQLLHGHSSRIFALPGVSANRGEAHPWSRAQRRQ
jgi:AcrR family transcriptional regulator